VPIVARFDGTRTCEQIALEAGSDVGEEIPFELVVRLANDLDQALFLDGARYQEALAKIEHDFAAALVRPASHAGGAYFDDAHALRKYLDDKCLEAAKEWDAEEPAKNPAGSLVALVAPHIDPWRGAVGYGHAYGAMQRALEAQKVTTFILLGTSHAPMRQPFALCRKGFETPLGTMEPALDAIDALAKAATFDPYADQLNHKREHSLEFQVVFLKHLLVKTDAKIVPILAGLGEHQARATDPAGDVAVEKFLGALRAIVEESGGHTVLVAGADLAHIGPRFADASPSDERLADLDATDRASLERAVAPDAREFWSHVARDLETRRVCGLGPIYSMMRALPGGARGNLLHYEQTIDAEDRSVVSHAALGYFA
jgi:AmmeMemoRadiSam system protein B